MDDETTLTIITLRQFYKRKRRNDRKRFINIMLLYSCMVRRRTSIAFTSLLRQEERKYWMFLYQQYWFESIWTLRHNSIVGHKFIRQFRVNILINNQYTCYSLRDV